MGEPLEVVVRNAIYVTSFKERLICMNKPGGSCVPGLCIRTKDAFGNTITLDITHSIMSLLFENGFKLSHQTADYICDRLKGQKVRINKDEMKVLGLSKYIPKGEPQTK